MARSCHSTIVLAFLVGTSLGVSAARADVTDTKVPLNYNFHGLVQPTDWSPAGSPVTVINSNADRASSYRSIQNRGMIWDPASIHSIAHYSGAQYQQTMRIGVIPKGANHIFWQTVHAGAIKAGQEYGFEILR